MKISELFLHVQIQVVTYLWCQINPSITGFVLTIVLSALSPGYAVFRRLIIRKSFFRMTKISELFLHVQIQVVAYLWCQINSSITGLVLTLVLSALNQGYADFRRLIIRKSFFRMTWKFQNCFCMFKYKCLRIYGAKSTLKTEISNKPCHWEDDTIKTNSPPVEV